MKRVQQKQACPIYDFHNGTLKQSGYHGLQHAVVYFCNEQGKRGLKVVIKLGASRTIGDHRFCFKSYETGIVYSPYEEHDRARFKAIELSMA